MLLVLGARADESTPSPPDAEVDPAILREVREQFGPEFKVRLTKHFIEMHGGTIEVASETDVGSTFTVLLPVTD